MKAFKHCNAHTPKPALNREPYNLIRCRLPDGAYSTSVDAVLFKWAADGISMRLESCPGDYRVEAWNGIEVVANGWSTESMMEALHHATEVLFADQVTPQGEDA